MPGRLVECCIRLFHDPQPCGGGAWCQPSLLLLLLRRRLPMPYNDVFSRRPSSVRPALLSDAGLELHRRRDKLNRATCRVNSVCPRSARWCINAVLFRPTGRSRPPRCLHREATATDWTALGARRERPRNLWPCRYSAAPVCQAAIVAWFVTYNNIAAR